MIISTCLSDVFISPNFGKFHTFVHIYVPSLLLLPYMSYIIVSWTLTDYQNFIKKENKYSNMEASSLGIIWHLDIISSPFYCFFLIHFYIGNDSSFVFLFEEFEFSLARAIKSFPGASIAILRTDTGISLVTRASKLTQVAPLLVWIDFILDWLPTSSVFLSIDGEVGDEARWIPAFPKCRVDITCFHFFFFCVLFTAQPLTALLTLLSLHICVPCPFRIWANYGSPQCPF